jgi:transposase
MPKARANKTGFNLWFLFKYSWKIICNKMLYIIFQYYWEHILIQRILIGYEAILETTCIQHKKVDFKQGLEAAQQPRICLKFKPAIVTKNWKEG